MPVQRGAPPFLSIGVSPKGAPVSLSLPGILAGRALIQGSSGAGKSKTLRRIVEEAHKHITTIIVDPEGEFSNLAQHIGAAVVSAATTTTDGLTAVAIRARQHRLPVLLDLSDVEADTRIEKATAFFAGLIAAPRELWGNTVLVVVDEAHLLAPHLAASSRDAEIRRLGVAALTDLCSRGRKRGVSVVIATQRLAKLATSVRAELHNVLIGLNMLDRDVQSAADILGWSYDRAGMLRDLAPGQFVVLGPAISSYPEVVTIAETRTEHLGGTPSLSAPQLRDAADTFRLLELDKVVEAPGHKSLAEAGRGVGTRLLDSFLLDDRSETAARILRALIPISPNATTSEELIVKLGLSADAVDQALDLLGQLGAIDAMPRAASSTLGGWSRIARLSARLRVKSVPAKVVGLA